jgi:hypothetical protein
MTGNDANSEPSHGTIGFTLLKLLNVIIDKYRAQGLGDVAINLDTVSVIAAQFMSETEAAAKFSSTTTIGIETRAATLCKLVARFRPVWAVSDENDCARIQETKLLINEISALFVFEAILRVDPYLYDKESYQRFRRQLIYVLRFHSPTTEMLRTVAILLKMNT